MFTLTEEDVSDSSINVDVGGFTTVDHQTVDEFHALGALPSELTRDDNFTTLGTRFHDESEDTVAGSGLNNQLDANSTEVSF